MDWLDRINPQLHHWWSGHWTPRFVEPLRTLYDHELVLFAEGECQVRVGSDAYACPKGSFIIVPPGVAHLSTGGDAPAFRYCAHFDWAPCAPLLGKELWAFSSEKPAARKIRAAPSFVPKGVMHGRIGNSPGAIHLAQVLARRWQTSDGTEHATCRAVLLELLIVLLSPRAEEGARRDRASELAVNVRDALDSMDIRSTTIRDTLENLGRSYEHLMRVFTSAFGISPLRYVNSTRFERAKLMLAHGETTVASVARTLGFDDAGYFTRAFKKYAGVTPSAYAITRRA